MPATRDAYLERFGKGATGGGWYAFDYKGVHFVSLVNVVDLKANGLGSLGAEQLAWLDNDLARPVGLDADRPVRAYPALDGRARWGWGTEDGAQALALACALRLGDRAERPYPSAHAEGRRRVTFHTARSTAFPQPAPGPRPGPARSSCPPASCANISASPRWSMRRRTPRSRSPTRRCRHEAFAIALLRPARCGDCRRSPPAIPTAAKKVYEGCQDCHSLDKNDVGPRHRGVFGRKAGSLPDFAYSDALEERGLRLERGDARQMADRSAGLPSGRTDVLSSRRAQDRADVIAFLRERAK